jgi:hypothetical protein
MALQLLALLLLRLRMPLPQVSLCLRYCLRSISHGFFQVKLAASAHPGGCVLVTDAIAALGLGDGSHMLGDVPVVVCDGKATLAADGNTLAGAVRRESEGGPLHDTPPFFSQFPPFPPLLVTASPHAVAFAK